ncbi:HD domain-containing protein [bacterium]|nr:HD domain-containing protein [bacterium]
MEIRDVVHGSIFIDPEILPIVDSRYFQRLRHIKQLGFGEYSYPSATHNRYIHSLGAMHTATVAWNAVFTKNMPFQLSKDITRLRSVVRLAALLHDSGHGPLSHTSEIAMPPVGKLELPEKWLSKSKDRKATHEDYTLKLILASGLTKKLEKAGAQQGFGPQHVVALIEPGIKLEDDFFLEKVDGETIDFRPICQQLISSELDADRMDYLRRDSLHAGVSYGQFDFDWLGGNLTCYVQKGKAYLALQHRALYSFEDFLISRFHMFLMVYFHHKSVVYDAMLGEYFSSPDCDYQIPADVESYCDFVDAHLYSHLNESKNPWARRISDKDPYRMLIELHSGIPATKNAASEQKQLLESIQDKLNKKGIHYLAATSTGELSKYFRRPGDPIFVRYNDLYNKPSFIPLEDCTDLFQKYSEKRSINRVYVAPEHAKEMANLSAL